MTSVDITRVIAAAPQRVWAAFADPAVLAAWFWPARLSPTVVADVRPGGRYRIEGTGMAVSGTYLEVEPLRRLVFTWQWDGDETESLVTLEFGASAEGKTVLSLRHDRNASPEERDAHAQGWNDCLDRLDRLDRLDGSQPTSHHDERAAARSESNTSNAG